jgi:hypothetical protein
MPVAVKGWNPDTPLYRAPIRHTGVERVDDFASMTDDELRAYVY